MPWPQESMWWATKGGKYSADGGEGTGGKYNAYGGGGKGHGVCEFARELGGYLSCRNMYVCCYSSVDFAALGMGAQLHSGLCGSIE